MARGLEDYYAGRGEAQGVWLGGGAGAEDLAGEVSAEPLARLFEARHPGSGTPLGAGYGVRPGEDRVTGWDLTFSAPKSVSVLWAVGGGDPHRAAQRRRCSTVTSNRVYRRLGFRAVAEVLSYDFDQATRSGS